MDKRRLIAPVLGVAMLITTVPAVAQDDPAAGLGPEGVEWTLSTLAGEPVPAGLEVTLFLSGGEVVGNAGCNAYFGSYELDGSAITFPTPFGATRKVCEDPTQAVEDAYLPLLQAAAAWVIDESGALSLTDQAGTVQLVFGEAPIDITASDVDALVATLADLQAQIDAASAEVAALAEATANIPVDRFDRRVTALEQRVSRLGDRLSDVNPVNLRRRIATVEETVRRLDRTIDRFRTRIQALEAASAAHERRLAALED